MKKEFDWKKHLLQCMKSTEYCCIATIDKNGPWANPVYFAWDDKLNLYFISQPHSKHMQNLKNNSKISVAIYNTSQDTFGDVTGIQLLGNTKIITNKEEISIAKAIYHGRRYGNRGKPIPKEDNYTESKEWQFVKVAPKEIYYFDTKFFGEERKIVPKGVFK